ncbi:MAG: TonB-dependent receptor, partial [Alphaproteobacteria bacterium]|nr:TonB-dependent receptor [Alphaproteobacteria bacterium]
SVSLPSLVAADLASAQQAQNEEVLTVVGSRVKGRTALDSNVPVDVVQVGELQATPSLNIKDAVQAVSPSFAVERDAVGDGNTLLRTTSLRGLNSGEIVLLVNNKRVHRSAILIGGYQTADLGTFSTNSIKSISVLRDGAAAQYGADAVAGVINLTLDDSEGITGQADYSKYYAGDGAAYTISSKVGMSLADRGFFTVNASYGHTDPTNRVFAGHLLAQDLIDKYNQQESDTLSGPALAFDGQFNDPAELDPLTIAPYGIAEESRFNITWNSQMEVGENSQIYTFGNFSRTHVKEPFNYRAGLPIGYSLPGVGGNSGASKQISIDPFGYAELYGEANAERYKYLLADGLDVDGVTPFVNANGGGFAGLGIHPNGYNPWFEIDSKDIAAYAGFKGEFDNGLTYDLSGSLGRNRVDYNISDTLNASLGAPMAEDGSIDYAKAQTAFYIGALVNIERSVGVDFGYQVDTDAVEAMTVSFGAEYRSDQYYKVTGEENSWKVGPLAGPGGVNVGSDGFGGFNPANTTDDSRHNYAVYVDVDTDITEEFNVAVAARYEDYSDFGDNLSWKIATRYQVVPDLLAIRGAASTGFHAPSIGQINNTQVSTGFAPDGSQTQTGTFPADSELASFFNAEPLRPELARNLSAGFIFTPGADTNITIDVFQIKLLDRIRNSKTYKIADYPSEFAALVASDNSFSSLNQVQFFANSMDTKTRGIEAVATHTINLDESTLRLVLAMSHITNKITKFDPLTTDRQTQFNEEHGFSPYRATFTANWNIDAFTLMGRARWFSTRLYDRSLSLADGSNIDTNADASLVRIDKNPGRVFFDVSLTYDIDEKFSVTVGADNVLDTYPLSQPKVVEASQRRGRQYLDGFDWQGGKYYARIKAAF